ncbi:MAG: hypothetical protein DYG89_20305 [Caldilinea sp. CFX5]|nr:hypothetical protein [Caldilinea sp. CFX5]
MALYTERFIQEITGLVAQWQKELGAALGQPSPPPNGGDTSAPNPLQQKLALLIQVANGELTRGNTSKATVQQVETALQDLLRLLLGNSLHAKATWPADFWQSDLGILVSRVRWWLSADELITISNAAALAFGENSQANRMRIVRAIDSGLLDWVPDPSVVNPQQNRRVLRPQVERLRDQRRLPE